VIKHVLIVGGGTAGWLTAGYLAKTLGVGLDGGIKISLIESADIGILGVGEGTFPTIRKTLKRIGINEAEMVRECNATFKQGAKFVDWRFEPGNGKPDHYLHSFQVTHEPSGLDLLSYWLLGVAGNDVNWDEVNTPQKIVADAHRAPKLLDHSDYNGPLNYAYHFDVMKFANFLRKKVIAMGVNHIVDTIDKVNLTEDGSIESLMSREHGQLYADLYIDCTGFSSRLIGHALDVPYKSCRQFLFCDTALAVQVPYDNPDSPIASYTISTAQEAGWTWDIGLDNRRGVGYVYSSAHTNESAAEAILFKYLGNKINNLEPKKIRFDAGYREINWKKNCVAIGLSSGFFEPLEATGIIFIEVAAVALSNLFPWRGDMETAAKQYNEIMRKRYERALDFIKLHYCLSERRDSVFWLDNVSSKTVTDSLQDLLERWKFRPPMPIDIDLNVDMFTESSWQYVLYGMGYKTDLSHRAGSLKYFKEAGTAFSEIRAQARFASSNLPSNRELIKALQLRDFGGNV
jgi:flavin-dependent dehydrogenase